MSADGGGMYAGAAGGRYTRANQMIEFRCECGKLLAKFSRNVDHVEIKCPRCKVINILRAGPAKPPRVIEQHYIYVNAHN